MLPYLEEALQVGLQLQETTLAFTSLYGINLVKAASLPGSLYQKILKVGAVSPAIYYEFQLLAEENLKEANISVEQDEHDALFATDFEETKALASEVLGADWMLSSTPSS